MNVRFAFVTLVLGCSGTAWWLGGCSSGAGSMSPNEAGADGATDASHDGSSTDARADSKATVFEIVTTNDAGLRGGPGEALALRVLRRLADGGTAAVPPAQVTWTTPETVIAQDPNDAGPNGILPEAGVRPTAFFVLNDYRKKHLGALFIVDPGTMTDARVEVTATISGAGQASAWVSVSPAVDGGDPARGKSLFGNVLGCAACHGTAAAGTPPVDGGDGGVWYEMAGDLYPYPAPGLNDTTTDAGPNLAADPTWSAGLLGMAIQSDMDNHGVALRVPMLDFFQASTVDGGTATLTSQDVADIYAWLKTQP